MTKVSQRKWTAIVVVMAVLIIDQVIKIWVKTHMHMHDCIYVTDWFQILFTENDGMAFGMEIVAKLFLTLFRIVAVGFIVWYLARIIRENFRMGYVFCLSLILAGALGNILDCVFYGVCFSESTHAQLATWVPLGQGYATWLHGRVVDMFYFPIIRTTWPEWMPIWGGRNFVFFSPIFNFADASISCGIIALLLFYGKTFSRSLQSLDKK